ncbi:hypothetical protein COU58_04535 [Candidatus Pacearchaeota archaeon CG10_big_fil_rev_8_21_14_0_10_32_42]|nr:MAG: hypothetical protein COU58_04535 [Candidatus Pacearchaeota archaeon CG10_big_fil_rev_8_21_14_0_10_32_42]
MAQKKSRPDKVSTAVTLLWIVIAVGVISSIFNFSSLLEIYNASGLGLGGLIFTLYFSLLFLVFLIWKIGQGKNWARITYLVLFILGVPFTIYGYLTPTIEVSAFLIILRIAVMIVQIVALVFLFQKPSSDWFKSMKK